MTPTPAERRSTVAFLMPEDTFRRVYAPEQIAQLSSDPLIELLADRPLDPRADAGLLRRTQILVTGWGTPTLDDALLDGMPELVAVAHSAGTLRGISTPSAWERGIAMASSAGANAVPVAEFAVAMIVLAAKHAFAASAEYRRRGTRLDLEGLWNGIGFHGATVGLVGLSRVGRAVAERLSAYDVDVLAYDPVGGEAAAEAVGARLVGLDELARRSDVVSLHAPSLPSTSRMIDAEVIGALRVGASLVNTARGDLVDQEALADRLDAGEIHAVLDVTDPDVLPPGHRLWSTPNTFITPHIAGSLGNELGRLSASTIDEVRRFARTGRFAERITAEQFAFQA